MLTTDVLYKPQGDICYGDGREQRLFDFISSHPRYDAMRNSPQNVLSAIDEFGQKEDYLMTVGKHKGNIVVEQINTQKPKLMVEIGGYVGYSAIMFGAVQRAAGGEQYISLEINPEFASVASSLVALAGLQDFVKIVMGPCNQSLRALQQSLPARGVDLLFLDHEKDLYITDLMLCEELSLVKPGSVVIADNVISPGAPLYVEYVRGSFPQKCEIRDQIKARDHGSSSAGKPEIAYETRLHESFKPTGERVSGAPS